MSLFGSIAGALGGLTAADDTPVKQDAAALQEAIRNGGVRAAATYGPQGAALNAKLADLSQRNVGYDSSAIDRDSAALSPVLAHYLAQFQNGGLAGAAAVQAQQQARALNAHGGVAGIRADTLRSADTQGQVANVAQGEISQAGEAVNALDAQKAAIALKKAVLAAQVSHANLTNHLASQQTQFDLRNSQQQLFNQADENLNNIANQAQSTDIDFQHQQNQIGAAGLQTLASLAGAGLSAGIGAFGAAGAAAQPAATGLLAAAPAATVPGTSGAGAGYALPTATLGRSAVPYQPIFNTPPTLPNTASFFNRTG